MLIVWTSFCNVVFFVYSVDRTRMSVFGLKTEEICNKSKTFFSRKQPQRFYIDEIYLTGTWKPRWK